jgi:hypothetical protein
LGVLFAPALASAADDLSSGGLAPPPPIETTEPRPYDAAATERELEQADRRDAGRGLEFVWFNAEGARTNCSTPTAWPPPSSDPCSAPAPAYG